ncbi:MAG: RhoGAP domain-containing protein, partial [Enterovibrio sp.]
HAAAGTAMAANYPTPLPLLPTILRELFAFCSKIAANHTTNKMDAKNLAVCIAPNFMPSELDPAEFMKANPMMLRLVTLYIEGNTAASLPPQ